MSRSGANDQNNGQAEDIADSITRELAAIHLQQQRLLDQEREALDRLQRARGGESSRRSPGAANSAQERCRRVGDFTVGDRVYVLGRITNRRHNASGQGLAIRAAVVTSLNPGARQVHFRTYSGFESWRAPHNLRPLTQAEHQQATL